MLAIANAENSYCRYAKLALLGKKTVIGDKCLTPAPPAVRIAYHLSLITCCSL